MVTVAQPPVAIATDAGPAAHADEFLADGVIRLRQPDFSPDAISISFSTGPFGKPIAAGQNVEQLYAPLGVVLDSDNPNSYVAADQYVVDSRSRGLSAANLQPRWTADLIIEFIEPVRGQRRRVARRPVPRAGFYVAHVYPGGTGLAAYDIEGRLLARIYTETTGSDFLGIASNVPIATLRVFRVPQIDPNFTIDDLTFDVFGQSLAVP